jgi:NRAMP (natural resistance-associated macrophage protein)-like metal ion transporter
MELVPFRVIGTGMTSSRLPENGIATAQRDHTPSQPNPLKRFLKILGPGLITGASDDDPSGIGTYAMAGASFGYGMLWTALLTFPLMAAVQFICAKIGLVCGCGLAAIMRRQYSRWVVYPAVFGLVITNTINAAADIAAIAAGVNLLVPVPPTALIVPIGLSILVLLVWGSYPLITRVFKWLTLALFAYIGSAFLARPDWAAVFRGTLVPEIHLDSKSLSMLVAILGTTISPYLFFWQADHEVEEEIAQGRKRLWQRKGAKDSELRYAAWDVNTGMLLSNVVMYFIILATAATLHRAGQTEIETATHAAEALRPLAGEAAFVLMALGLIGSGVLAVPILVGSGAYAVAEVFGWKYGLSKKPGRAKQFYLVMAASTVAALLLNFCGIDTMRALFWTAVINGFLAPPLLVVVMLVSNNRAVMGKRVNGRTLNLLGWATTALMSAAAIVLVWTWVAA